jgi:hypothetical protein
MVNIYQVSKTTWVAANSRMAALKFARSESDESPWVWPRKVANRRLHSISVTHDNGQEMSCRRSLDISHEEGGVFPCFVPFDVPNGEWPLPSWRLILDVASRGFWGGRHGYGAPRGSEEYSYAAFCQEHAEMHYSGALYSDFLPHYQRIYAWAHRFGVLLSEFKSPWLIGAQPQKISAEKDA